MPTTITSDKTSEIRYYSRRIEFENVAPILLERRYSHGGKEFLPTGASTRWNHGSEIEDIAVYGPVLKKDRTAGQQLTEMRYVTPASHSWDTPYGDNAPAWLLELFDINVPTTETSAA